MTTVKRNPHLFLLPEEAGEDGALKGTACLDCGTVTLLTIYVCPKCLGRRLESRPIGRTATLLNKSVVHHPADGFEAPYLVARIRLPEGPSTFAPLMSAKPEELAVGDELSFRIVGPDSEGDVGFAYVPVKERAETVEA
jgi:uncharacterized OB-fold protein